MFFADLESAFYIVSLIYMGVMFAVLIALLVAILTIRARVIAIEDIIKRKVETVSAIPERGKDVLDALLGIFKKFS
jgi:hypothetical protein